MYISPDIIHYLMRAAIIYQGGDMVEIPTDDINASFPYRRHA